MILLSCVFKDISQETNIWFVSKTCLQRLFTNFSLFPSLALENNISDRDKYANEVNED